MALLQYDSISFAWPEADRRALDNVSSQTGEAGTYPCRSQRRNRVLPRQNDS